MSMHLEGPWLTTTGKRRSKRQYQNADAARRERELKAEWDVKQTEWAKLAPNFSAKHVPADPRMPRTAFKPLKGYNLNHRGRDTERLPSVDTGVKGAVTTKAPQTYTGTKVKGIATMHKSNAVPVFTDEEAIEISQMRRG
jgi:hypothetical protein